MRIALREDMIPAIGSLPDKLSWLESVGIDGIELCAGSLELPIPELQAIFSASPVKAAAVEGVPRLIDPDPQVRAAAIGTTRHRLEMAAALGAVGVLIVPQFGDPRLPDLSPWKTAKELEREFFVSQLRQLAPAARSAGVPMFLEPLNRYEAWLVNRLEQGTAIAKAVGPEVAVMADFFHMHIEEANIATALAAAGSHVVYVHAADSNRLQPGRGHLDFTAGFRALKTAGFDGWIGIECRVDGPLEASLRESAGLIRRLWSEA